MTLNSAKEAIFTEKNPVHNEIVRGSLPGVLFILLGDVASEATSLLCGPGNFALRLKCLVRQPLDSS